MHHSGRRTTTSIIVLTLICGALVAVILGACGSSQDKYLAMRAQAEADARASEARIQEANARSIEARSQAQIAQSEAEKQRWLAEQQAAQAEMEQAIAERNQALAQAQIETARQEKYSIMAANQPTITAYLLMGLGATLLFMLIVVVIKLTHERATSEDQWRRQQEARHAMLLETLIMSSASGRTAPDAAQSIAGRAVTGYMGEGNLGGYLTNGHPPQPSRGNPPVGYLPPGHRRASIWSEE